MERLSIGFKGPLPSSSRFKYILTVIDEFSRYPFAYPCSDMNSATVISHLNNLFSLFGTPAFVHSDRGTSFMSAEIRQYLHSNGIATSRTTPYHPQSNGQCERYNGIIWKTVTLILKSKEADISQWETVLTQALHCIRSLLCTSTNETPHERFLGFPRRSPNGHSIPTWLSTPGKVFLRRHVRTSKHDPLVDEVELIEANPMYAHIRYSDGRENTVSTRDLAPTGIADDEPSYPEPDLALNAESLLEQIRDLPRLL